MQAQEISRPLFRSATSVGANIAERQTRHQGIEYVHDLIIAQGSANETEHWLHTAKDCGLGLNDRMDEALRLNDEVARMVTTTINTIREKQITEENANYLVDSDTINDN